MHTCNTEPLDFETVNTPFGSAGSEITYGFFISIPFVIHRQKLLSVHLNLIQAELLFLLPTAIFTFDSGGAMYNFGYPSDSFDDAIL